MATTTAGPGAFSSRRAAAALAYLRSDDVAGKPDPPPQLSDSDRAALDEFRAEKEFQRRTVEKSKARFEKIRAWVTFGTAVLVLRGIVWEQLKSVWEFFISHAK